MTNTETNPAANVAELGATVAPEKGTLRKALHQKKVTLGGQKAAPGGQSKTTLKKPARADKKAAQAAMLKATAVPDQSSRGETGERLRRPKGVVIIEICSPAL